MQEDNRIFGCSKSMIALLLFACTVFIISLIAQGIQEHRKYKAQQVTVEAVAAPGGFTPLPEPTLSAAATPVVTPTVPQRPVKERWPKLKAAGFRTDKFVPVNTVQK